VSAERVLWCGFEVTRGQPLSVHGMQPMALAEVDGVEMYVCQREHDSKIGAGTPGRWLPGASVAPYMEARGLWPPREA
jgi:hypothetical protein